MALSEQRAQELAEIEPPRSVDRIVHFMEDLSRRLSQQEGTNEAKQPEPPIGAVGLSAGAFAGRMIGGNSANRMTGRKEPIASSSNNWLQTLFARYQIGAEDVRTFSVWLTFWNSKRNEMEVLRAPEDTGSQKAIRKQSLYPAAEGAAAATLPRRQERTTREYTDSETRQAEERPETPLRRSRLQRQSLRQGTQEPLAERGDPALSEADTRPQMLEGKETFEPATGVKRKLTLSRALKTATRAIALTDLALLGLTAGTLIGHSQASQDFIANLPNAGLSRVGLSGPPPYLDLPLTRPAMPVASWTGAAPHAPMLGNSGGLHTLLPPFEAATPGRSIASPVRLPLNDPAPLLSVTQPSYTMVDSEHTLALSRSVQEPITSVAPIMSAPSIPETLDSMASAYGARLIPGSAWNQLADRYTGIALGLLTRMAMGSSTGQPTTATTATTTAVSTATTTAKTTPSTTAATTRAAGLSAAGATSSTGATTSGAAPVSGATSTTTPGTTATRAATPSGTGTASSTTKTPTTQSTASSTTKTPTMQSTASPTATTPTTQSAASPTATAPTYTTPLLPLVTPSSLAGAATPGTASSEPTPPATTTSRAQSQSGSGATANSRAISTGVLSPGATPSRTAGYGLAAGAAMPAGQGGSAAATAFANSIGFGQGVTTGSRALIINSLTTPQSSMLTFNPLGSVTNTTGASQPFAVGSSQPLGGGGSQQIATGASQTLTIGSPRTITAGRQTPELTGISAASSAMGALHGITALTPITSTSGTPSKEAAVSHPGMGQITLIAPPLQVASEQAEQSGAAVVMDWPTLARGAGPLDAGGLSQLKQALPSGVQAIYPALPQSSLGSSAVNLSLAPSLAQELLTRGFGSQAAVHANRSVSLAGAQRSTPSATPLSARLVPAGRPAGAGAEVIPTSAGGAAVGALNQAGSGQASRGGVLDFLGMPVRLAPSLSGRSELSDEVAARRSATGTASKTARPNLFSALRSRLFPAFQTVSAEPDQTAWNKAAPAFGLRDSKPTTLFAPDARAQIPTATSSLPQMGSGDAGRAFGLPSLAAQSFQSAIGSVAHSARNTSRAGLPDYRRGTPISGDGLHPHSLPGGLGETIRAGAARHTGDLQRGEWIRPHIPYNTSRGGAAHGTGPLFEMPTHYFPRERRSQVASTLGERLRGGTGRLSGNIAPFAPAYQGHTRSLEIPERRSIFHGNVAPSRFAGAPYHREHTGPLTELPEIFAERMQESAYSPERFPSTLMSSRTERSASHEYRPSQSMAMRLPDMLLPVLNGPVETRRSPFMPLTIQRSTSGASSGTSSGNRSGQDAADAKSAPNSQGSAAAEVDMLAHEVWSLLKRRIATESERHGRW